MSEMPVCKEHDQIEPCQDRPDCQCPPPERQTRLGARHLPECRSCWRKRNPE